jgi:hypothetical protein
MLHYYYPHNCAYLSQARAQFNRFKIHYRPVPAAARSKAWVLDRSLTGIVGCHNPSNPSVESRQGHGCLSVVSVVCCQVDVSASGLSLVQRSPTDCGVSKMGVIVKPRERGKP